jgi:hypothetical protein
LLGLSSLLAFKGVGLKVLAYGPVLEAASIEARGAAPGCLARRRCMPR